MDLEAGFTDLGTLPCTLDRGLAARAAIGLLVLATDQTMEHEFRQLVQLPGVAVYPRGCSTTPTSRRRRCAPCGNGSRRQPR